MCSGVISPTPVTNDPSRVQQSSAKGNWSASSGGNFFQDRCGARPQVLTSFFHGGATRASFGCPSPQQQLQLIGSQRLYRAGRVLRAPGEVPFRKSDLTCPKTLPVIDKDL